MIDDPFPDPAQRFRGHANIGGDVYQRYTVEYRWLRLQQSLVALLRLMAIQQVNIRFRFPVVVG